jgi:uncharacterized protein YdeI (YjbR/CyaY-like superfamily)
VLWVCYYKKHTKKASITWDESVAEALCFGWIDGLRKSIDDESYRIRFTPRKKTSTWSKKNIETVGRLIKQKRMLKSGLLAFSFRKEDKSAIYSYEQATVKLAGELEETLQANKQAWDFFEKLIPSVKNPSIKWVMSAKKEDTRNRRFAILLESCSNADVVPALRWTKKKAEG